MRLFRKTLMDETVRFALLAVPDLDADTVRTLCYSAETSELIKIKDAFRNKAGEMIPISPQLKAKKEKSQTDNNEYKF